MQFDKLLRAALLAWLLLLTGCSMFTPKPVVVDTQQDVLGPIDPALEQGFSDALVLLRDEKYVEAEAALIILTTQFPDFAGPWSNLAIAQSQQEKYTDALTSLDNALKQDEKFCQALSLKGVVLRELGQFQLAKDQYKSALICNPEDHLTLYNLGVLSDLYLHDEAAALAYYQQFLATQGEQQDETIKSWVVDLKRRVPEQDQKNVIAEPETAAQNKPTEPQLAGEE